MGMKNYELKAINDCLDKASNLFKTEKSLSYRKLVTEGVMTKDQAENLKNRESNIAYHEIVKAIKANQDTDFPWRMSSFLKFLRKTENVAVSTLLEKEIRVTKEEQMQLDKVLEDHYIHQQIQKEKKVTDFKMYLILVLLVVSATYCLVCIIYYEDISFLKVFKDFPVTFRGFLVSTFVSELVKCVFKYFTTGDLRQRDTSNNSNLNGVVALGNSYIENKS